jgi:hypothetical protein
LSTPAHFKMVYRKSVDRHDQTLNYPTAPIQHHLWPL